MPSALEHLKHTDTPLLDQLSEKHQLFVLTYFLTANAADSARKAGYHFDSGRELVRRPVIAAALKEQQDLSEVRPSPTQSRVIDRLWYEAHNLLNTGQARISALKTVGDFLGMSGGGGNSGDSALDEFFKRAGRAVAAGVFEGVKDAGRKAVTGADAGDKGVRQENPPGRYEVIETTAKPAKVVADVDNLAGAFEARPEGEKS